MRAGEDGAGHRQEAAHPQDARRVQGVEPQIGGERELVQRDEEAAEPGEQIDEKQQPEVRRRHRLAPGSSRARPSVGAAAAARRRRRATAAEELRERQDHDRHEHRQHQVRAPPAHRGDEVLHDRHRSRPPEAVGRLHDRQHEPALVDERAGDHRREHHQAQAVGAHGHHHAVQRDQVPQRGHLRAEGEAGRQQHAAHQHEPPRPHAIDEHADHRRAGARERAARPSRRARPRPDPSRRRRGRRRRRRDTSASARPRPRT